MTLSEWMDVTRSELELFEEFWGMQSRQRPDIFAPEMEPWKWRQQFESYRSFRAVPGAEPEGEKP